jgi:pilus assembly protein CpaE
MKLFSESNKNNEGNSAGQQQKNSTDQQIIVISPRKNVLSEITSQLLMHGLKNISEHQADFFMLKDDSITHGALAVVVDVVNVTDDTLITETAMLLVSAASKQIFVGSNDSIAFAQKLKQLGIIYIHVESQLAQIADYIQEPNLPQTARAMMKISILGCKGGVGTTTIAYDLFRTVGALSSIPMLLVQGASGSSDLDLQMGTTLPRDGSMLKITQNLSARIETPDNEWSYEELQFNQYNLVFFDHSIYPHIHERLEMVIAQSHTIILVISRELSTLRIAKSILDEYNRIVITNPGWKTRMLLCLNENHLRRTEDLNNDDIREYLGCSLTCVNPYSIKREKPAAGSPLYQFAADLLGKSVEHEHTRKRAFSLSTMLRRVSR